MSGMAGEVAEPSGASAAAKETFASLVSRPGYEEAAWPVDK